MVTGLLRMAALITALISLGPWLANASEVMPRSESTILEVTDLTSGGKEVTVHLDLSALEAIEPTEIVTSTLWTNGVNRFHGVSLPMLLKSLGLKGERLRAASMNDFAVDIPLDDGLTDHAILAYRMNGEEMSRRNKGPLWIIFPFDQSSRFRTETIYARSLWQLNRIEVIE